MFEFRFVDLKFPWFNSRMKKTRFQIGDYEVLAVPVLHDNFVYLIGREGQAVLIDAGEAKPVFKTLEQENLQLLEIFITRARRTEADHGIRDDLSDAKSTWFDCNSWGDF